MENERFQQSKNITLIGAFVNLFLAILKLGFGFWSASQALIADGIHSFADLITDFMVLFGTKMGNEAPDEDHPYGHGRIETLFVVVLSVFLIGIGVFIIYNNLHHLWHGHAHEIPTIWVIIVALISIITKELVFYYTLMVAKKTQSNLLKANAWHHRADSLSSAVVLIGGIGVLLGFHHADSLSAMIVAGLLIKMGISMGWHSVLELVDTAMPVEQTQEMLECIKAYKGVEAVHQLRSRSIAGRFFVDVHVQVKPFISVSEGHFISDEVYQRLKNKFKDVEDIVVHVDPEDDEDIVKSTNWATREQIEQLLKDNKNNLPGYESILQLRLDYLSGKIYIHIDLPLTVLPAKSEIMMWHASYEKVLQTIPNMGKVYLYFKWIN